MLKPWTLRFPVPWLLVSALLLQAANCCAVAAAWPVVALPKDSVVNDIGEQMTANGVPMRVQGFQSQMDPAATANWFRHRLREPLVENKLGPALILGRREGEHYITIRLSPVPNGTGGVVIVSHLKAAYDNRERRKTDIERLLSRLPGNSELLTEMESTDGGKLSRFYILSNSYHEDVNRDYIIDLMREDGMILRHRSSAPSGHSQSGARQLSNGEAYVFSGARKEALAVIGKNATGRTVVQVNVISDKGRLK